MKYLSFDLRALALMRICIAAVVLLDLSIRLTDLEAFYSNSGVAPLNMVFQHAWNKYYISVHTISGLWQVQLLIFMANIFCAFMLLIGYRTQLFTFLCWFMMLSLHNRNGLILQGGDDLLRMVLFWAVFIPWGARYSCDRLLDDTAPAEETTIQSVATIAYLFQICYLYTGSALLKGQEWNTAYSALYYAYSLDQIAYPITGYLYHYPELLKKLTFIAYYFELLVPVLFFIPVKHSFFRAIAVLLIILFHSINLLTLLICLFPVIGMSASVGILPSFIMDKFDRLISRFKEKAVFMLLLLTTLLQRLIPWKKPLYVVSEVYYNIRMFVLIFLIVFVFDWNFSNLSFVNSKLSDNLRFIGYGLRLDQSWGMFAPGVFKDDGWYVLEGVTEQNATIDLLNHGKKVNYKKPESVVAMIKNDRWRKYGENCIFSDHIFMRGYFCNYEKRIWNERHPGTKIKTLRVIYMTELTLPDYKYSPPVKNILWECND